MVTWEWLDAGMNVLLTLYRWDSNQAWMVKGEALPELRMDGGFEPVAGSPATIASGSGVLRAGAYTQTLGVYGKNHPYLQQGLHTVTAAALKTAWVRRNGALLPIAGFTKLGRSYRGNALLGAEYVAEFVPAWPYWLLPERSVSLQPPNNLVTNPGLYGGTDWSPNTAVNSADLGNYAPTAQAISWQQRDLVNVPFTNVRDGDTFTVSATLTANPGQTNRSALYIGLWCETPDHTARTWVSAVSVPVGGLQAGTWRTFNGTVTIPAGYTAVRWWMNQDRFGDFDELYMAGPAITYQGRYGAPVTIEGDAPVAPRLTLSASQPVTNPVIVTDAGVTGWTGTLGVGQTLVIDATPGRWAVTRDGVDVRTALTGPQPSLSPGPTTVGLSMGLYGSLTYWPGVVEPDSLINTEPGGGGGPGNGSEDGGAVWGGIGW